MNAETSGTRWWPRRQQGEGESGWNLGANEVVRLPGVSNVARASLRVMSGRVVVTSEGDPVDHVLEPGDELALAGRRRALAWALAPSRIELDVAVPASRAVAAPLPVPR